MSEKVSQIRTIIIVWSWNQNDLSEWSLDSSVHTADRLYCIDESISYNGNSLLIDKLKERLSISTVFLFLHRSHGYNKQSIQSITEQCKSLGVPVRSLKCFLFGEGNDFIYLSKNKRGLLGSRGSFNIAWQDPTVDNGKVQIIDACVHPEKKLLKLLHFNTVWNYYQNNFKAKIEALKQDLLVELFPLHQEKAKEVNSIYEWMQNPPNKLLLLRLLSFVGKLRKGSDLEEELKKFEQINKKSYLLDDCNAYFSSQTDSAQYKCYQHISAIIKNSILSTREVPDLVAIRNNFDQLIAEIPGAGYY